MKEELIKQSRIKGFLSRDQLVEVNDDYYYLWMCEFQKWLREEHDIDIIIRKFATGYYSEIYINIKIYYEPKLSKTYEKALEVGLLETLKLIPDET
jgi:hypothetical protein